LGLPNKKTEGDSEIEERQDKRGPGRYPRRHCIFGPEKIETAAIDFKYILARLEKANEF
jgi:hypothetical protein